MDVTALITIAACVIANIGTTLGLFMWATTQATTATQNTRDENKQFHAETRALIQAIQQEMKDFHGRLCALEERRKNDK